MNSILPTSGSALSADDLHAFEPGFRRALFLDQRVRRSVAASFRHILERANGQLELDGERFEAFLRRLGQRTVSPLVFSFYCDAVLAIEEDNLEQASRLLGDMLDLPPPSDGLVIVDLEDPSESPLARRLVRSIDTDPSVKIEVIAPSKAASEDCRAVISAAFSLMDAGDPELAAEIRALLREIVLAASGTDPKALIFGGASSFMLWGGIVLSTGGDDSALQIVQKIVHESSHNLLFGLSTDSTLVENSDDELFSSPLRREPRPMDGIYHAAFVLAREHRAVWRLLDSGILSPSLQEEARKELAQNKRLFDNAIKVVREHGKLTSLGETIMQGAVNYMATA